MQSFEYYSPTEIVFGRGAEAKTAEKIKKNGGTKVVLVYVGGSVVRSGLLARLEKMLDEAGLHHISLGGVQPNPRLGFVREAIVKAVDFGADFILPVGGGSAIDSGKAIAHGTANPDADIWDIWLGKMKLEKTLPMGVVLTIAAAGSETSNSAVLTNEATGKKCGLGTELNRPRFAIMNPELTYTLPRNQIAYGIADILMHTMDRYFSQIEGNDFTDVVAEGLIKNVMRHGRVALEKPDDYHAMSELMWCGSVSHSNFTGLGRPKDFATHKLGHELSGKFDVAHGASLTAVWGSWARYVYKENPERFSHFASSIWGIQNVDVEQEALAGIAAMERYFSAIGMPINFTELGIGVQDEAGLAYLADMCTDGGKKTVAEFKKLTRDDVYAIYQMANH